MSTRTPAATSSTEVGDAASSISASLSLHHRAVLTAPGGVQGAARYWQPHPIYFQRASGGHLWDVDGNEMVDLWAAAGPIILGHNDSRVLEPTLAAVRETGLLLCLPHTREIELAEQVSTLYGGDMTVYGCGGSDVLLFALRAVRAYTGKSKFVKCEGAYHGWNDPFLVSVRPPVADATDRPTPVVDSTGLSASVADECVVVPYNDLPALEQVLTTSTDIAAVFIEPVLHTPGCVLPEAGYLQGVREMCTEHGVPLVFDEIITGFRHALAGYQSIADVRPDLTALGKAMSNGFPISALTGRREIMESLTPVGSAYYSGTFMGQSLLVEGALHTIAALRDDAVYQRLYKLGQILDDSVAECIVEHDLPVCFSRCGSVWALYFGVREVHNYRDVVKIGYPADRLTQALRAFLRAEGFYFHPATTRAYLMDAHTDAEIDRLADLITDFLLKNRDEIASVEAQWHMSRPLPIATRRSSRDR